MMRVFAPATPADLRRLADGGSVVLAPAYAATGRLAAEYPDADDEELAYAAMSAAAEECSGVTRIVIAADAEGTESTSPGVVEVVGEVPLRDIASFHVGAGDDGELSWYATQEVADLAAQLGA